MTVKNGDTAYRVAEVLPGGSGDNGRYVIVGLRLADADALPPVTHVAFRADQFDRFLMQLLDNSARARTERLNSNPPPEDAVLNIEPAAVPVVNSSAEPSVVKEGRALICLKIDSGRWDRRPACLHFAFDETSLEQLSETVRDALAVLRDLREPKRGRRIAKLN
jgi:hypothetical protein